MWPYQETGGFMMASGIMVLGMKLLGKLRYQPR